MEHNYVVYKHTSPSGKVYIGITKQCPEKRWCNQGQGYLKQDNEGNFKQPAIAHAILKYGFENFQHEIVYENLTKDEANQKEKELIAYYNSTNPKYGYNITQGGDGREGLPRSEETKVKLRQANLGKKQSLETRAKESIAQKKRWNKEKQDHPEKFHGRKPYVRKKPEERLKTGPARIPVYNLDTGEIYEGGVIQLAELYNCSTSYVANCIRDDRHKTFKGMHICYLKDKDNYVPKVINNCYSVICMETEKIYKSIRQASEDTGISRAAISQTCKGEREVAGEYHWQYYFKED